MRGGARGPRPARIGAQRKQDKAPLCGAAGAGRAAELLGVWGPRLAVWPNRARLLEPAFSGANGCASQPAATAARGSRRVLSACRPVEPAGFGGRDLVGRDLVACSRFWGRDRVATAVVRGASPFFATAVVRATNRHGRDHPANLPLSLGVVGRSRRVAETPGCQFIGFPGLPSPSSRQSQCTHLRIPRPPLVGGAVPRCPRSPVQTSAPVPGPVPVFAPGSG